MTNVSVCNLAAGARPAVALMLLTMGAAVAQQPAEGESAGVGLQEVVVTARRVEESVQRVPLSISVYTPETLERTDVRDLPSLTRMLPGVNLCCTAFNNLTFVRGIARGAPTYFADVPASSTGYANYFDLANVQVLRGPQGTLFGQASVAGAFVYEPRKPGFELGGYVSASLGSFDRRSVDVALDLPVSERLAFRLAGTSFHRAGYVHDLSNNKFYGDADYYVVRPAMTWKITDSLENYTMFQYMDSKDSGYSNGLWVLGDINFSPAQLAVTGVGSTIVAINGGNNAAYFALADRMLALQQQLGPYKVIGGDAGCGISGAQNFGPAGGLGAFGIFATGGVPAVTNLTPSGKACPGDWHTETLIANTTTLQINDQWSVKNIFGYRKSNAFVQQVDGDNTPLVLLRFGSSRQTSPTPGPKSWSDELQLRGTAGRFSLSAGLFATNTTNKPGLVYGEFDGFESLADTKTWTSSRAVYAQTDFQATDRLTLTLGGRYNQDKIAQTGDTYDPVTGAFLSRAVDRDQPEGNDKFTNFSYTAGVQFQITPETMLFLTNSRGYSAGGFQTTAGAGKFEPQVLTNFEAGVKGTWQIGDVTTRVNTSVYYGLFDDIQVDVFQAYRLPSDPPNTSRVGFLTANAAKAKVQGVDFELTVLPTRNFEIGVMAAYNNNKYTDYVVAISATQQQDLSDSPFLLVPEWKTGLHMGYVLPFSSSIGRLTLTGDFSHRTIAVNNLHPRTPTDPTNPRTGLICLRYRTTANGYNLSADGGTSYPDCVPTQHNLDLGIQWQDVMGNDSLSASLNVTNVTENEVTDNCGCVDYTSGSSNPTPAPPRMYFLSMKYEF